MRVLASNSDPHLNSFKLIAHLLMGAMRVFYGVVCAADVNYIPPENFESPRYLARSNRVSGGMLVTVEMFDESHACTDRFDLIGAPCLQPEPSSRNFGSDAVRCPFAHVLWAGCMGDVKEVHTAVLSFDLPE